MSDIKEYKIVDNSNIKIESLHAYSFDEKVFGQRIPAGYRGRPQAVS